MYILFLICSAFVFQVENAVVVELEDGLYAVNFVPYELGVHTVSVMYRDVDIPGSPFQFTVNGYTITFFYQKTTFVHNPEI